MALVTADKIENYIPQKAPIVMVGELISSDENATVSCLKIDAANIFVEDGQLEEAGIIENIAQTAALRMGYHASQTDSDNQPPVGFIGAISRLKIFNHPNVGEVLSTKVEVKNEIFGITLIQGSSHVGSTPIAECEMKIFLADGSDH